jgi:hypothetical protein
MFCLSQDSCSLKYTRQGKPYLVCRICLTRAFINSWAGLRGVATAPHLLDEVLDKAEAGDEQSAAWVRGQIAQLNKTVSDTMTGKGLPEATNTPVPYVDAAGEEKKIA